MQAAERIGTGRVTAWRVAGNTLLELPTSAIGKPMLWYTEAVALPPGVVVDTLEAGNSLVRLERHGHFVHVRDLSGTQRRRASVADPAPRPPAGGVPGAAPRDPKIRPIETAVAAGETGALIASFPILGAKDDSSLLVDLTGTFAIDIPAVTGRGFVARTGGLVAAVDPSKSYIQRVRVRGNALNIRSHLTHLAQYPAAPAAGPQPVSVVLGHSLVFLPDTPMAARPSDPRVGDFPNEFSEFETAGGAAQARQSVISRFRLEKANPAAAVSDPVKPITCDLGPGIPERWKPHITAGVLQWSPAFEAAGFSNAIRVLDAPTPAQDADWSPEGLSINVIRWVTEEKVNAMGPHVVDPAAEHREVRRAAELPRRPPGRPHAGADAQPDRLDHAHGGADAQPGACQPLRTQQLDHGRRPLQPGCPAGRRRDPAVDATRLGVASLQRSLARLDAGTGGDARLYAGTDEVILGRHVALLQSVNRLLAGALPPLAPGDGPTARLVPAAEQRAALQVILGDGAASLEPFAAPAVIERVATCGGYRAIDRLQSALVSDLMAGAKTLQALDVGGFAAVRWPRPATTPSSSPGCAPACPT